MLQNEYSSIGIRFEPYEIYVVGATVINLFQCLHLATQWVHAFRPEGGLGNGEGGGPRLSRQIYLGPEYVNASFFRILE